VVKEKKGDNVHSFVLNSCTFIIDSKYNPRKILGEGAYGVVCSAVDEETGKKVAIKKIGNAFDDLVDAKRILREVKLLRHFKHGNIISLVDLVPPEPDVPFEDLYIVLDFMETDLHKIIYSKNKLTDDHIQYFVYQILKGLKYIHTAGVIHRDLKPSNLLLNGDCHLKICDLGLARGCEPDELLTEYVVTRWYRAPEVMCACQEYDNKIDVWSVGCIMGELLGRKPLFPGDDYIKQMNLIFNILGTPTGAALDFITNERALQWIQSLKKKAPIPFEKMFPGANATGLDLLNKMLSFNPNTRISVDEALNHPYLEQYHEAESELDCKNKFDFEFEKNEMTEKVLKDLMWEEIMKFRPNSKQRWEDGQKKRSKKKKNVSRAHK